MNKLEVQTFLENNSLDELKNQLGINSFQHPTEPLVILNYDQIESPKTNSIVRECRGLTLEMNTWNIVSRSFFRFYNYGEVLDELGNFNFTNFHTLSKEDGSLCNIYNYKNKWYANTRGTFGLDELNFSGKNWQEWFCQAMGINSLNELDKFLDPKLSYACEFCSLINKVVRQYPKPTMFLLSAFDGLTELSVEDVDKKSVSLFQRPERFEFRSVEQIQKFLNDHEEATFEGVVICDRNFNRWKLKNLRYVALHRLKGSGDNLFHPKYIIPFILRGESDEILTYFPEIKDRFFEIQNKIDKEYENLLKIWEDNWQIENQKEFALKIVPLTKFSSILFTARKNKDQNAALIADMWKTHAELILKVLF